LTVSALTKTDWNQEWLKVIGGVRTPDSAAFWNEKATRCRKTGHLLHNSDDPYVQTFIDYAGILPGETILDIGCGPGALAIPLAKAGHPVTAVDFSQKMLAILFKGAHGQGGLDITPMLADWRDDWETKGIECADVVLASRSIAASDLETAIHKVNKWARRRVCISTAACGSPWFDRVLENALGRHICQHSNFAYCMNILFSMDMRPELRFIDSPKDESWPTRDAAVAAILKHVAPLAPAEEPRFERYLAKHLIEATVDGDPCHHVWKRDYIRVVEWAFIAWEKLQ
jgi:SAM-dependent methyltransferase